MTRSEAIEKIRKILQPSGRTSAEWDTAQMLAAALAERHNIDLAELDRQDQLESSIIMHKKVGSDWLKAPDEANYAAIICKDFFEISSLTERSFFGDRMVFIGTEMHLQIAEYVFNFLITEFRYAWNHKRGRCRNRKQFMWGLMVGLSQKLEARFRPPGQQLNLALEVNWAARRKQYIDEHFGKLQSRSLAPKSTGSAAARNGYHAGQEIEIRPAVNGADDAKRAELPPLHGRLLTQGN